MYETYEALRITRNGAVFTVTLASPPTNAVRGPMHRELQTLFPLIDHDAQTKVVVLTGAQFTGLWAVGAAPPRPTVRRRETPKAKSVEDGFALLLEGRNSLADLRRA